MSSVKTIAQLGRLVAHHHGWPAAKAFKAHGLSDAERAAVSKSALDLLRVLPGTAGALMSAALAVRLETVLAAPVQVVAGTLAVEGIPVLGPSAPFDGAAAFADPEPAFDGHVWVMIGATIVDVTLFRLAYAAEGPARLARHVDLAFGPGKALFVDDWKHAARLGLGYEPQYVLSAQEVTRLMGGAYRAIVAARA